MTAASDLHHILLCWSEEDLRRAGGEGGPVFVDLQRAGVADMAERIAATLGGSITLTSETPSPPVERAGTLAEQLRRIRPAARIFIWFAPDPLYRVEDLRRAAELLSSEEEMLPYAVRSTAPDDVAFAALRASHTPLFTAGASGILPGIASVLACEASPVPLRPALSCVGARDLPTLYHELERERLLDRWYPRRVYERVRRLLPPEEDA